MNCAIETSRTIRPAGQLVFRAAMAGILLALLLFAAPATSRAGTLYVSNHGNNTIWDFTAPNAATPPVAGSLFANTGLDGPILVKGGQKVQRVALQKCGTQWLVDTVIVGRRQGCM